MEEMFASIETSLYNLDVNVKYLDAGYHDAVSNVISSVRNMKNIMGEMVQVIAQQQEQIRELQRVYGRD